jgi:alanyl-tRNA synthetase
MLAGSSPGEPVAALRSAKEIRETFLRFFEEKGHTRVPSASLIPSDPTLLFTNAGMVPFKRVFTGEETRPYKRATTTQKCMRVSGKHNDLEEVGRSPRHHTFFEMLGNFSFGDYFKQDAIRFAWELVTERFGLEPDRLAVTVFREDDEAAAIWEQEIGIPRARIYRLGEADNFWSMGDTGPCGPCSEIYLDRGPVPGVADDDPSKDSGRFLEFWNLVFMQFDRDAGGRLRPLPRPSVDTGAGLERTTQVLAGLTSNYDTDLFVPILARVQDLSGVRLGADAEKDVSLRVVADHARAVSFLIADGVLPSNEGRGYVLRRILRRAARHGVLLGLERPFLHAVSEVVIEEMGDAFPELVERRGFIIDRVRREEERFLETLGKGLALLEGEIRELRARGGSELPGHVLFKLYDTYGFPLDLTQDILRGQQLSADEAGFRAEMETQRARSREAWRGSGDQGVSEVYGRIAADLATQFVGYDTLEHEAEIRALLVGGRLVDEAGDGAEVELVVGETPFYAESGGQVGDRGVIETAGGRVEVRDTQRPSGELVVHRGKVVSGRVRVGELARLAVDREARAATVRNHSGTHLLHAALRAVLGSQAVQKGSLVSPERLRFDFTHDAPLTDEQIERIEDLVNGWIEANEPGVVKQMGYRDAIAAGAIAMFTEKYGDRVRVVSFGGVSTELCGGTHAKATGDIGVLQIVAQSAVAAGVRRIEALTGLAALRFVRERERALRRVGELLRVPPQQAPERVEKLLEERKEKEREIAELKRARHRGPAAVDAQAPPREVGGLRVLVREVEGVDGKELRDLVDDLRGQVKSGVVLVASKLDGRVSLALGVTPDLRERVKAGDLVREIAAIVGGKGGGRPDFAQAGGTLPEKLPEAIERLYALLGGAAA